MEGVTVGEALSVLKSIAFFLEQLGLPGLIALLMCGPTATVLAVCFLDFLRQRHMRHEENVRRQEHKKEDEERRQEHKADMEMLRALVERHREHTSSMVERHRTDTAVILHDMGERHSVVAQFYKDNVELLKTTQRMAGDLRDIVLNNTLAMERLNNNILSNFYCPAAREAATGKK